MGTPIGTEASEFRGLQIVNIVSSGVLGTGEIDTKQVAADLCVEHTSLPGRLYLMPAELSPVAMVFRSGTYTIAGASSWDEILKAVSWLYESLNSLDAPAVASEMKESLSVKYLVVTGDLDTSLNLSAAVIALGMERSEYEPEQFPALIYHPKHYNCTVLLFSTGNITITGVQDVETAHQVFQYIDNSIAELLS